MSVACVGLVDTSERSRRQLPFVLKCTSGPGPSAKAIAATHQSVQHNGSEAREPNSRQRQFPNHIADFAHVQPSVLRRVLGYGHTVAGNRHETDILGSSICHLRQLLSAIPIEPVAQPLQLLQNYRNLACFGRMHLNPNCLLRPAFGSVADSVIPARSTCVLRILSQCPVQINAPGQPIRV